MTDTSTPAQDSRTGPVVPAPGAAAFPDSARDPLQFVVEVARDPALSAEDKDRLIRYANDRFRNRRRMAYIALWTIVLSFFFIGVASTVDGVTGTTSIATKLAENQNLIAFTHGFLTAVVAAYYGMRTWRPSS